jgi:precorrin-6B methylase 2
MLKLRAKHIVRQFFLSFLLTEKEQHLLRTGSGSPKQRRRRVGMELGKTLNETVASGPFAGVKLVANASWGSDYGSMLLGMYEREVVERIAQAEEPYDLLINVGAGDGYYAVSCLHSGIASRCIAFEASERGRHNLLSAAENNGVLNSIEVRGFCASADLLSVPIEPSTLLLVDIEGAEFELLTASVLNHLRTAHIIVELHEWQENIAQKVAQLLLDARRAGFSVDWLTTSARDPNAFEELREYSDDDRWSLCSEGRQASMRWLCLSPSR